MDIFFKKAAEMADGIFDLVSLISHRMESSRHLAAEADINGAIGEITTPIAKGSAGEVVVAFEKSRINFSARARTAAESFCRGERVRIVSVGGSVAYVASLTEDSGSDKLEKSVLSNDRAARRPADDASGEDTPEARMQSPGSDFQPSAAEQSEQESNQARQSRKRSRKRGE